MIKNQTTDEMENFRKRANNLFVATRLKIIKRAFELDHDKGMEKLDEFFHEMLEKARKK